MRTTETLVLYRRHSPGCPVEKMEIPTSVRRFVMDACDCMIWIHGKLPDGSIVPRESTGFRDLKLAEAFRAAAIVKHSGSELTGPSIESCIEMHLQAKQREIDHRTLYQHRLILGRLAEFMESEGVQHIRNVTVDHLERFKASGMPEKCKASTRVVADSKVRCFFRAAFRRGWIKEHIIERVPAARARTEQKDPFTDAEVQLILEGCHKIKGWGFGFSSQPATFRLLLELMLETGLRCGDAVFFDPAALHRGDLMWIYSFAPQKRVRTAHPKIVEAYLPDALKERIDSCVWLSERYPFCHHPNSDPDNMGKLVYDCMQNLGRDIGVKDCRPHRLRDTFAVRSLLRGVQLEDVSRLLGHHSVSITERYYAKWTASRKRRLERIICQAGMDGDSDRLRD